MLETPFSWRACDRKVKGEEVMQIAAISATLAPMCRNSQRGIKKLLVAAAADEGLQHCDVASGHLRFSANTHCARPHAHTSSVGIYLQRSEGIIIQWRSIIVLTSLQNTSRRKTKH